VAPEAAYIVDALRTPIGRHGGALAGVRADDLAAHVIRTLAGRYPEAGIDEVFLGDANQAGEDNRNVARMAVLLAGLPTSVPGATVNRLCGSGMEAVVQGFRALAVGDAEVVIAGGVESMSRAPTVVHEGQTWPTTLGWRMVNPALPAPWTVTLGEGAEILADRYCISRDRQDAFALASHRKAATAWADGLFKAEIAEYPGVALARDESIRPDTSLEKLARLRPVFREGGTVTAGNASPVNDGAAAVLMASRGAVERHGFATLARVVANATAGVEPQWYGIGPVEAARVALRRAGIGWGDLDTVELNEAFAAQALACLAEWPDLDPDLVNPQGGAIAIGHPLGCSGARLVATMAHRLARTGGRFGLAAMCIGVGQGIAVVIESENS
jgi:acetyl-CoA acetyltransferase family protein